jgi:serine/threonine protein kinase
MSYAKKGNLRKCLSDIIKLQWQDKLQLLKKITLGLKVIHKSNLTHGDFHDGNILMSDNYNELFIIDLGLCKPINDLQDSGKKDNNIYGVLPFMAPEILKFEPYTPASDIYSFSMIMWEFTSGIPPFNNRAHDHHLIEDICKGDHPKISVNTPKCYVDLMKKCWDLNPFNRPTITEIEDKISEWIKCIGKFYVGNKDGIHKVEVPDVDNNLKNDMLEFIEANNALTQEQANISTIVLPDVDNNLKSDIEANNALTQEQANVSTNVQPHSQAYYTSRILNEILYKPDSEDEFMV